MYLDHYQLKRMPFEFGPDPKFLWLGSKHKEAFAILRRGILESNGFIVIIGEAGTGKSTLLNVTAANFGSNIRFAKITDPALDEMDFFNFVADAFGMGKTFQSKSEFLIQLGEFVKDAKVQSKKVILVIDEAQRLTPAMLEQIRVFSNIETVDQKVICCIFAGQTKFLDMVNQNRAMAQMVFFSHIIQPLTQSETGDYIAHRLKVAGTEEPIFTSAAVQEVFRLSGGNPRMINILCDQALLNGYAAHTKKIGPELIKGSIENKLVPLKPYKEPAAEAEKQEPAKPLRSTGPTTENKTEPSRIATAKTDIRTPGRKTAYWVPIALTVVLGLAAYFYLNAGFRVSSRGSQMDPGQAQSSVKPAEPTTGDSEIGRLQGQMLELRKQKDDAETRLRELQTQFGVLEKDQQELKAAKALVAEFETAMGLKDKSLLATDQKFKETEKALAQEKSDKDRLVSELSSKEAVIAELQKKLESSGGEVDTFKKENTRLQSQLVGVNNQKGAAEAQGNKLEATAQAYGDGLVIAKKLAEESPSNPQVQRDFLLSYNKLGEVAVAQGKLEEAARAYGDGLVIAKKLAEGDPSNSLLQRDLWVSYWRLADIAERQQKAGEAKGYWKQAFDVLSGIEKQGLQLSLQDRQYLEDIRRKAGAAH